MSKNNSTDKAKQSALESFESLQTVIESNNGDIAGIIAINIDEKTHVFSGGSTAMILETFAKTAHALTRGLAEDIPIDEVIEWIVGSAMIAAESAKEELEEENKQ